MVRQLQTLLQLLFIKKPQLCLKFVRSIAEDLALSMSTWLLISLLKLANADAATTIFYIYLQPKGYILV